MKIQTSAILQTEIPVILIISGPIYNKDHVVKNNYNVYVRCR